MSDNDDIVKEFLVESHENLDRLDRELVDLEKCPDDRETLASVFRTIHTIKGTSGFLAFSKLESLTHAGESLLARLRDGLLHFNPTIATALLAMVDAVRAMLQSIEAKGHEGDADHTRLIATLSRLLQSGDEGRSAAPPPKQTARKAGRSRRRAVPSPPVADEGAAPPELAAAAVAAGGTAPQVAVSTEPALKVEPAPATTASDSTIRVDVSLLDQLMNLVGELVLTRNQILQFTNASEESGLLATSQRLNLITGELQEGVMKTRMQPIGNIWSKFPRTVRDLALACGRQVRIEMSGEDTELDKSLIEAIKDPLTHLVRNAVDHGIEPAEARRAAGKNPEGRVFLHAFHEGGQVNIEISDDGAGLNLEKVRQKAIQKGVTTAEQAAHMSEREITNLIFLPGFSTADKVSNVSGRGVGMDVVKTHIERIGGTVDVQSTPGQGLMVRMKIPLTLAIIPALIVSSDDQRYAIPQVNLLELVRLDANTEGNGIEMIHGAPVYRLRGRLLPLVYLGRELRHETSCRLEESSSSADEAGVGQLDFTQARLVHEQWLERLRNVLDNRASMIVEEAGSATGCALGQWLCAAGVAGFRKFEAMHALEAAHRRFHELMREVVTHKVRGDRVAAEHSFVDIKPAFQRVLELLTTVERKVRGAQSVNIVVLNAEGRQFGLVVDEINDTEEIVVKPLAKQLRHISVYSGATIRGDGKVALILDVIGLAQSSSVLGERREQVAAPTGSTAVESGEHAQKLVLFTGRGGSRMAVPLSMIARLENIPGPQVERSGDQWVTRYRGQILPLIRVTHAFQERRKPASEADDVQLPTDSLLFVLVLEHDRKVFGLVVNQILDIVESTLEPKLPASRPGVLFSSVIADRVTELLDVPAILQSGEARELAETATAGN